MSAVMATGIRMALSWIVVALMVQFVPISAGKKIILNKLTNTLCSANKTGRSLYFTLMTCTCRRTRSLCYVQQLALLQYRGK